MQIQTQEVQIILIIKAIWISKQLSYQKATKIYKVPEIILYNRINSITSFSEYRPIVQKLSKLKEEVIISYILDRDSRGFSL